MQRKSREACLETGVKKRKFGSRHSDLEAIAAAEFFLLVTAAATNLIILTLVCFPRFGDFYMESESSGLN